jgi:hypothetical protein
VTPPSTLSTAGASGLSISTAVATAHASPRAFQTAVRASAGKACMSGDLSDVYAALEDLVIQGDLVSLSAQGEDLDSTEDTARDDTPDTGWQDDDGRESWQAPPEDQWDGHGSENRPGGASVPDVERVSGAARGLFEIHLGDSRATFSPPSWIGNYTPRKGSGLGWGCLALLAKRLVLFSEMADWLRRERATFVDTFDLRHWAPRGLNELGLDYVPNCLQKGMVMALNRTIEDPNYQLSESYFSKMGKQCVLLHESGRAMPLAALFSRRAQTLWAASLVHRFVVSNGLPVSELGRAQDRLRAKGVRATESRRHANVAAMRLEEFIAFVRKPFRRGVRVETIICEAERVFAEETLK